MALSKDQIKKLKRWVHLQVIQKPGQEDYHLNAIGTVIRMGTNGCALKILKVISKGKAHPAADGERLKATFEELNLLPE